MRATQDLHTAIIDVIQYFHFFRYAPQAEHIYMYLPIKTSRSACTTTIRQLVSQNKIERKTYTLEDDTFELKKGQRITLYAMRGEGILCDRTLKHYGFTLEKLRKVRKLLKTLQLIPSVHLIGLSGSCTMGNADKQDDVDIFIISAPGRLWTARFMVLVTAILYGKKRRRMSKQAPDKACFNLFFDGLNVTIHERKRNVYIAHEVLQMKPIGMVQNIWNTTSKLKRAYLQREKRAYMYFLRSNIWVFDYFPNYVHAGIGMHKKTVKVAHNIIFNYVEKILGFFQLLLIKHHVTNEIISQHQLWFFPNDFERKLKSRL